MQYSQVVGQNEIKQSLISGIEQSKLSHCYVFEGPKDMGKFKLAVTFAQSLFCNNFNQEPCESCNDCIKVNSMNHPDLHILDVEEKTIKREVIDELISDIYKKPYESSRKIFIINNAHLMTVQAANTFLKTLEEPPKDTIIILLTTNINLLLPTIVSRCQVIKFKNISTKEIQKYLTKNYEVDESKASLIANYSKGILNKAVNIINDKDEILSKRSEIINVFDKIIKSDEEIIFNLENYFEEKKDNIDEIIEIMMLWIRDITYLKNNLQNLLINKDLKDLLSEHSFLFKKSSGDDIINYLQKVSDNIKNNVNYKLTIDKMLLKIQEEFK